MMDTTPLIEPVQEEAKVISSPEQPMINVVDAVNIKNPWICQTCGAILGSVHHEKIRQGLSLARLILFRGAVKLDEKMPENFIFGKVDAGEFGCSRCGTVRHWHPTPETMAFINENRHHGKRKNRNI